MTRSVRLVFWAAGAAAAALAFAMGPLWAGYAIAGATLAFIAVLMGTRVARAIGDWRLEHPWRRARVSAGPRSEGHGGRRAA